MKIEFLKFSKKERLPELRSLRPSVFDAERFWFYALGGCFALILAAALIGVKLFHSQYYESYKQSDGAESFESLINAAALKAAIEKRSGFLNQETPASPDPSL